MSNISEMDLLVYSMSAEINGAYNQPQTNRNIEEGALLWQSNFSHLSKEELFDKAVKCTRENMTDMNWSLDDIEGVAWFLGIYTRIIMKSGLVRGRFADIIMPCMRKYFNSL